VIAKLTGMVEETGADWAVVDVSGVGYLVLCSGRTLAALRPGEAASVHVETHVREDHIHLYGFAERVERDWFRILTQVQGVGTKVALAILSVLAADDLLTAIAAGDKAALSRAAGVGPKLAGRIVAELKEKTGAVALGAAAQAPAAATGAAAPDAVSALVNLGYGASEAMAAVAHGARRLGDDATVEELIRAGLAELGPREQRA
jgi:Holliday junction DNA helicase RuvA